MTENKFPFDINQNITPPTESDTIKETERIEPEFTTEDDVTLTFEQQLEALGGADSMDSNTVDDYTSPYDFAQEVYFQEFDNTQDEETFESDIAPKKDFAPKLARYIIDGMDVAVFALAVVMILLTSVVRYSPVIGSSMEPTLEEDHVLLISGFFYTPRRNDIVVIQLPNNLELPLVKRVIAIGGDNIRIDFTSWHIYVNDELLDETGLINEAPRILGHRMTSGELELRNGVYESIIPHGHIFVLGDNRNNSSDSRNSIIGYVDNRYVVGRAIFRILPFRNFGTLR